MSHRVAFADFLRSIATDPDNCAMTLVAMSGPLVLVQLGLLLGVLVGTLVYLGRRARAGEPGIVQPIRLGAHHALHIVTVEDRRLLVGTGPGAAPQLICDLGDSPSARARRDRHADAQAKANGKPMNGENVGLGGFGVAARPRTGVGGGWDQGA